MSGPVVTGFVANVYGNEFVVNHMPLAVGSNTITATATDTSGYTQTVSATVNGVATRDYIRITATPESGISPLHTTLTMDSSLDLTKATFNCTGPGTVQYFPPDASGTQVTMATEGIYYCTASVSDSTGKAYNDTVAIAALSKTDLDNLLRAKWDWMKRALANGDVEGAVVNFYSSVQDTWRDQFTGLKTLLPNIANEMNAAQMNMVTFGDNTVVYELLIDREGQSLSFQLKFTTDTDGVWKIWGF